MLRRKWLFGAVLGGYLLIGLLTFGYEYNIGYVYHPDRAVQAADNVTRGALAGVGRPLYWVVEAFSSFRPQGPQND